jgi:TetR/AcrR family transcriptional repressor of mexJK operon
MGIAMSSRSSAAAVSLSPSQLLSARARILEAAAETFRTHGYDVPMDTVAAAANVAKQTLYNQFGSKEDLFKAMIADRAAIMRAPLAAHALERHPREMLTDVARQYYTHACSPSEMGYYRMIIGASQQFPEIGQAYYEAGPRQMLEALSQWIAREERLGRLDAGGEPNIAAEHFLGMITGQIEARWLLGVGTEMSPNEIERRAKFCADVFMRAFGPQRLSL